MIELTPHQAHGLTFTVRDGTRGVWDRGIIEEVAREYLWERIAWGTVRYAVDVGAHIGAWTLQAAQRAPQARVVSIEPWTENYLLLAVNTHEWMQRITAEHGAVYYGARDLALKVATDNTGGHCAVQGGDGVPIRDVWTLEEVVRLAQFPRIDVLKLDCEGSEHNILRHMTADLLHRTHWIVGEFHCTAEDFQAWHGERLGRTHHVTLVPHPNRSVKDLGMFFLEHRAWADTGSSS